MALSTRAQPWTETGPDLVIWRVIQNLWDPKSNPEGYVSLGVAENSLMHKEMTEYINANTKIIPTGLTYGDGGAGSRACRSAMAHLLNRKFNPVLPVTQDHICMTNGASPAIEHLSTILGDPGDVFLLGQPYYGAFIPDVELRTHSKIGKVSFDGIDPLSPEAVSRYASVITSCQSQGKRVAGIILCNPHNPLGRCYPRSFITDLMKLCNEQKVHLISDEVYALSVFEHSDEHVPFTSLLAIPTEGLIDPALTHVIYSLSKDFGANGLRIGAIISQHNAQLHNALIMVNIYSYISSLVDALTAKLLTDDGWIDNYVAENNRRLKRNYEFARDWAESHGLKYEKGVCAAFFLWVDLGSLFKPTQARTQVNDNPDIANLSIQPNDQTSQPNTIPEPLPTTNGTKEDTVTDLFAIDAELETALLNEKVFIASGKNFGSERPGWVRIVFSQEESVLREGLGRIERAVGLGR